MLSAERELRLSAGSNNVSFRDTLSERGNHSYELLVEAADDTLAENNLLQGVVEVKGPPRVLLLSSEPDSQRFLARVLRVQGFAVVEAAPEASALALPELVILRSCGPRQRARLSPDPRENGEHRDLRAGLWAADYWSSAARRATAPAVTSGRRSSASCRWTCARRRDSKCPTWRCFCHRQVRQHGRRRRKAGTKLDLAKAAAIAAADIMNPTDQIGILAFDAAWDWTLPFRPVGKGEWINDKLAASCNPTAARTCTRQWSKRERGDRRQGGGDQTCHRALRRSHRKGGFSGAGRPQMARAGVTVSTVSVGNDADVKLMAEIAREGKGRGYVALDPQTIPQIFTTETLLISRDLLIEKTFAPRVAAPAGPLRRTSPKGRCRACAATSSPIPSSARSCS